MKIFSLIRPIAKKFFFLLLGILTVCIAFSANNSSPNNSEMAKRTLAIQENTTPTPQDFRTAPQPMITIPVQSAAMQDQTQESKRPVPDEATATKDQMFPIPRPRALQDRPTAKTNTPAAVDEAIPNLGPAPLPEAPKRLWNLQDADILSVIDEVSQETGKNFVVDPRVTGKITLVSSKPIRQEEIYHVFLSVLAILGYSAIPSGKVIKIIPNLESGEEATKVASRLNPGTNDEVVVRVIPLQNVSAAQLIPVIRPMLPQWSNISAYVPGNVLVLLGRAANISRINQVIQDLDRASDSEIQIIPLKHASAGQVGTVLNNLQNAARAAGENTTLSVAVDERSNSILLGGSKAARLKAQLIISQLDTVSTAASGNTEVIYLRYLQAKTLAPLLSKIASNILGKGGDGGDDTPPVTATASTVTTTNVIGASSTTKHLTEEISLKGNILAEPNTNAVIITAPPGLMAALKAVIAKLDIRPAQVLIEGIIAQIDEADLEGLGIQWGSVSSNTAQPGDGANVTSFPNLGAGVIGIIPHVQLRAVLSILENTTGVDILSTPSVVVLDNQKAAIEVGQEVSVQTGSYSSTNSGTSPQTVAPFTTNSYKPVTLKLEVTPQLNLGSAVRLKINLKNDTLQNPQNPGVTPLINTSRISNSVIIGSEDVLVIGGLISNANNETVNKVPILGDIPILGLLFKQKVRSLNKKNLMVFIKPTILINDDDAMLISHMKYNITRSIQANYKSDLDDIRSQYVENRMPPWKDTHDLPVPFAKSLRPR